MGLLSEGEGWAMIGGPDGRLWTGTFGAPARPVHLAFRASNRGQVEAFHTAALAAGGKGNSGSGLRPQ